MNPQPSIPNGTATDAPTGWVSGRHRLLWGFLLALAGVAALAVLWRVEPAGQPFFPRCWLYQTTGLQCPGCGATRAVHALLNGRFVEAFHLNALVVAGLPLALWMTLRALWGWGSGRWWPNPLTRPWVLALLGGLVFGFGVGRNFGG